MEKQSSKGLGRAKIGALEAGDGEIGEILTRRSEGMTACEIYHKGILDALSEADLHVYDLLRAEYERLHRLSLLLKYQQC